MPTPPSNMSSPRSAASQAAIYELSVLGSLLGSAPMGAAEDDVVEGEVVAEVAGDDTIEAAADADGEIEDADVIGEIGLLDPAVAGLLRDTTGGILERKVEAAAPLSFPRLHARTQRFTLGEPRDVNVGADGDRIFFLRSRH